MVHILVRKQCIIAYYIDLVTVGGMNYIVYRDIPVKQSAVCIIIIVLTVEEETRTTLGIQVPKQHAQAATGEVTGQVYGCGCFANASFDIIDSNFFQRNKTSHKTGIAIKIDEYFNTSRGLKVIIVSKKARDLSEGFE